MNHESDGPDLEPPAQKVPAPEMPPENEIGRMEQEYRAEQYEAELRRQQEQREIDERMHQIARQLDAEREAGSPVKESPSFEIPADAQKKLEAQEELFREGYDRLDSQGIYTRRQILDKLAEKGLYPPDTAEEIEDEEVRNISAHAHEVHKPRAKKSTTLRRPLGPKQRDIADSDKRVESEYGKRGDST